jgi:ribosome-associated protein
MDIRKLQRAIVDGLEDVKAQDIVVFNTEAQTPLFERVIIASGTSNRQTKALASSVRETVKSRGLEVLRVEGEENGEWIIVDCGAAVVHIMQPSIRDYYHLEELWGAKPVALKRNAKAQGLVKASEPQAPAARKSGAKPAATKTAGTKPTAAKPAATRTPSKTGSKTTAKTSTKTSPKLPARQVAVAANKTPARKAAPSRAAPATAPTPRKRVAAVAKTAVPGKAVKPAAAARGTGRSAATGVASKVPAKAPARAVRKTASKAAAPARQVSAKTPARKAPAKQAPARKAPVRKAARPAKS